VRVRRCWRGSAAVLARECGGVGTGVRRRGRTEEKKRRISHAVMNFLQRRRKKRRREGERKKRGEGRREGEKEKGRKEEKGETLQAVTRQRERRKRRKKKEKIRNDQTREERITEKKNIYMYIYARVGSDIAGCEKLNPQSEPTRSGIQKSNPHPQKNTENPQIADRIGAGRPGCAGSGGSCSPLRTILSVRKDK
jgi:hypothetical protein